MFAINFISSPQLPVEFTSKQDVWAYVKAQDKGREYLVIDLGIFDSFDEWSAHVTPSEVEEDIIYRAIT